MDYSGQPPLSTGIHVVALYPQAFRPYLWLLIETFFSLVILYIIPLNTIHNTKSIIIAIYR